MQVHLTLSRASAMVQVGLRVPTPFAVRRSQASCELLARLQEFALHWLTVPAYTGSLALPGVRDRLVAAREFAFFFTGRRGGE